MDPTTAPAAPPAKKSTLTQMQTFRLMLWVDNNRDRIAKERKTLAEWTAEAAAHLKFPPSETNMRSVIDAHGIKRASPNTGRPSGGGGYLEAVREHVAKQQEVIDSLLSRVTALENAVTNPG